MDIFIAIICNYLIIGINNLWVFTNHLELVITLVK
jgi:hypothetical protein